MIKKNTLEGPGFPEQETGQASGYKSTSISINPSAYVDSSGNVFASLQVMANYESGPEELVLSELTDCFLIYGLNCPVCRRGRVDVPTR
jgi:hypothetical protein